MLVDLLLFAIEASESATIVLISNGIGCAYGLSQLRLRGHKILFVSDACSEAVSRQVAIEDSERLRWREDIHSTIQILAGSEQTQKTAPHSVISATEISTITITGEGVRSFAKGDTVPFYESSSPEMLKRKRDAEPSHTEQCQEPQKRNRTEPECPTEQQGVPDPEPTPLKSIPKSIVRCSTLVQCCTASSI